MPNPRNLCPGCHHRPSERRAEYDALCQCVCHDTADAAPDLLAACKAVLAWADRECLPVGGRYDGPWEKAEAAVAKAERRTDAPPA